MPLSTPLAVSILIIADTSESRHNLVAMLQDRLNRIEVAENIPDGMTAIKTQSFDLVMLDIQGQGETAFEIAEMIQQEDSDPKPTIIMLAAYGERGDAARCQKLGIAVFLTKPVIETEIFAAIQKAMVEHNTDSSSDLPRTKQALRKDAANIRILVVEDDFVNQILIGRVLEKQGWQVQQAENGIQALEAWREDTFDLILMDIQMPEMDGFTVTETIRRQEKDSGQHIPIIALTGHTMPEDQQKCRDAGMDAHIAKPIRLEAMLETIGEFL